MIKIHEKSVLRRTQNGWLNSYHTFSFGQFQDPTRMGFANLRVINEDGLIPGGGFAPHDHANMDILTLVLDGQLRHEDDQGNVANIRAGQIQGMSAGVGVRHSEYNASSTDVAKFLQIWLIPDQLGGAPTYHQGTVGIGKDVLLAGPAAMTPLIPLRSQTRLKLRRFAEGETLTVAAGGTDAHFVHLLDGLAYAENERLSAGDGMQIPPEETVTLRWHSHGAALVFEMPVSQARAEVAGAAAKTTQPDLQGDLT
jgi:hypothetical protein